MRKLTFPHIGHIPTPLSEWKIKSRGEERKRSYTNDGMAHARVTNKGCFFGKRSKLNQTRPFSFFLHRADHFFFSHFYASPLPAKPENFHYTQSFHRERTPELYLYKWNRNDTSVRTVKRLTFLAPPTGGNNYITARIIFNVANIIHCHRYTLSICVCKFSGHRRRNRERSE